MKNREIYSKDPSSRKLVNEGVASVNDETTEQALSVLRYELDTFVCDGQYAKGMEDILETYLKNVHQAQQPAVWVSGFYGSGKSHLVKMLRALWVDTPFPDGATARSIATLPQRVRDLLMELSTEGKRNGGLHAASGTLGAGASGSVRLALLRVVFKSVGLPEQYPLAKFVLWLKSEGLFDSVRQAVEASGNDWQEELDNFYVAEGLHQALVEAKPNLFSSTSACVETLNNLYPYVNDISSDDMIKAIRQAVTVDGKFPLTLVVLDEVQQFIGQDPQRSMDVQEAVEACCKKIGGKLLFIGTGQTAVTGTANLKRLEGRFTVRIELSDADVDAVIRQVILAKKPGAIHDIESVMQKNLGEISRHLSGTNIGHRQEDIDFFTQDYPILPVRRRFWENTLRVLDQTGTDSQLRNQLSMIHKVIQTNLDSNVGHVISADYLYFDSADKLLQARVLPRKVHERTMKWVKGTADEQLMARACGLVFLTTKLAGNNNEVGIRANVDTLADLLVDDLSAGSSNLRTRLPALLDQCELLMKVGDQYRIQTEESAAWNDEFLSQRNQLANESHRIEAERDSRVRGRFAEIVKKLTLVQGQSKVERDIYPLFDSKLPNDAADRVYVWVRDGWSIDENSVRAEARQAGNNSPTVFVFIPKRSADDLRHHLIDFKAAAATLEKRGATTSAEGTEAKAAMETTKQTAEAKIKELLGDAFLAARVFQGGGTEIVGNDLQGMISEAAEKSLQRLYPQFGIADHEGWARAYANAKKGAPDALKAVGFEGEPAQNQVCKSILLFIGPGKKGTEIKAEYDRTPYGWSGDAIDGGVQVLLIAGLIRAIDERGTIIDPKELERRAMGKATFKVESTTVTTAQRIQIRKVMQALAIQAKPGEELASVPQFVQNAMELANQAGGDAPGPARPNTESLEEIRLAAGNEQLMAIYNRRDELKKSFDAWDGQAKRLATSWPVWIKLQTLLRHADSLPESEVYSVQARSIIDGRLLLNEPDAVTPMVLAISQLLRIRLNELSEKYEQEFERGLEVLEQDTNWQELEPEQRHELLFAQGLTLSQKPVIKVQSDADIIATLRNTSLPALSDRVVAMPSRFQQAQQEAAKLREPKVTFLSLPRRTLKSESEVSEWLQEVEKQLLAGLEKGPVGIQ